MNESLKTYILLSSIIFIIMFILGVYIIPDIFGNVYKKISPDELRINSINSPFEKSFPHILVNNIIISIILIGLGILGNKIFPSIFVGYNALIIGENINMLNRPETFGSLYSFIPHGIIEIPTIILCTAFSYKFAYDMMIITGNKGITGIIQYKEPIDKLLYEDVIIPYMKYILPLIVISAIIECTISIYILRAIFNGV
jgi:uncharacterized membrane protein SpoIIM required for sporulation